MKIKGYNDFYNGWLAAILMQPLSENANESETRGYNMAHETGLNSAIEVLQAEIELGHIIVEREN